MAISLTSLRYELVWEEGFLGVDQFIGKLLRRQISRVESNLPYVPVYYKIIIPLVLCLGFSVL